MKKSQRIELGFSYLLIAALLTLVLFPLVYTVSASFKTNFEIMAHPEYILPRDPTFENYIIAWNSDVFDVRRMLWNSTYYTVIYMIFNLLSSAMGGYVFARGNFPGKKTVFALFSATMFISLGSITVYAMFNVLTLIGLNKSLWGLIAVKIFGLSIVNIYLVRSYINTLPKSLDEAAKVDGCNFIMIFFRIIAPLIKPILATIGILSFQASWNEYLMPSIFTMTNPAQRTLIVGVVALKNSGEAAASWNLMLAGTTIAIIPVLIAYAIGNRYFISGLVAGAVKG